MTQPTEHANGNGKRMIAWASVLTALLLAGATGYAGRLFDAVFVPRAAVGQTEGTDLLSLRDKVSDLDRELATHETEARALVGEWRRDQDALRRWQERMDERAQRMERKLDLLLARLRVPHDIGTGGGGEGGR